MAVDQSAVGGLASARTQPADVAATSPKPHIRYWAIFGGLMLAFIAYVMIAWISGPHFETVDAGPSNQPGFMDVVMPAWEIAGACVFFGLLYFLTYRPWRREGRFTTDGLLVPAFFLGSFQDPISAYGGHWFTYNANLVNYGSWVSEIPGWNSYSEPGAMIPEPVMLIGPVYAYFILIGAVLGCFVMRKSKEKWPSISRAQQIFLCFGAMCLLDFVGEGLVWLPLGFWEYPGGLEPAMFPDSYHKYPINEMLTIGALMTCVSCLRYFKDDKGMTLVERGAEKLQGPSWKKSGMRFLALAGAIQLIIFACYNLPNGVVGLQQKEWPKDLQERSYFTNGLCGQGTPNACPQPGVPITRKGSESLSVGPNGEIVTPPGYAKPQVVPFDVGKPGGSR